MDAGDSVYGVNSDKRSEVYNPNQEVMITEKVNADSGGTPESEILPSAVKKAVNGSILSVKLSGLNITEVNPPAMNFSFVLIIRFNRSLP